MIKFIKYYALEIYTVISMLILVIAGFMGDLSVSLRVKYQGVLEFVSLNFEILP